MTAGEFLAPDDFSQMISLDNGLTQAAQPTGFSRCSPVLRLADLSAAEVTRQTEKPRVWLEMADIVKRDLERESVSDDEPEPGWRTSAFRHGPHLLSPADNIVQGANMKKTPQRTLTRGVIGCHRDREVQQTGSRYQL
ncbi:unnamed protein product [Protopolystoma xenopodis]|uniref:Uncharacterized protein n=1 Tax=Protopolystoma xenopodis TaxID=117903 RepID=A0A3S5AHL2_9PLAT|nr:unnamed protein product [Protopolystoma xenopodis]